MSATKETGRANSPARIPPEETKPLEQIDARIEALEDELRFWKLIRKAQEGTDDVLAIRCLEFQSRKLGAEAKGKDGAETATKEALGRNGRERLSMDRSEVKAVIIRDGRNFEEQCGKGGNQVGRHEGEGIGRSRTDDRSSM